MAIGSTCISGSGRLENVRMVAVVVAVGAAAVVAAVAAAVAAVLGGSGEAIWGKYCGGGFRGVMGFDFEILMAKTLYRSPSKRCRFSPS